MFFIIFICAFILEQFKGHLNHPGWLIKSLSDLAHAIQTHYDDGRYKTGKFIWWTSVSAVLISLAVVLVFTSQLLPWLFWVIAFLIFYSLISTRYWWHKINLLNSAYQSGDVELIRIQLQLWGITLGSHPPHLLIEAAIREIIQTTHARIFGVFFWLMFPLLGPLLGVWYFLAYIFTTQWSQQNNTATHLSQSKFHHYAVKAYRALDYLPSRCTAILFALVGNFEIAFTNWRQSKHTLGHYHSGHLISFGIGALGISVAKTTVSDDEVGELDADFDASDTWSPAALRSLSGLILRTFAIYWLLALVVFFVFN